MIPTLNRACPDFFVVGAPKCGTTALHAFLRAHPDIFMPAAKEIHYFGTDLSALESQLTPAQHTALFHGAEAKRCVGETCIWALYSTCAAEEIRRELPEAKIVILLRNPVDMMYALHSEFIYWGLEQVKAFREAVKLEAERKCGRQLPHTTLPNQIFYYREVASYAEQVLRYYRAFPREQVHVILYDDFQDDLPGVYRRLLEFMEVAPDFRPEFQVINPNKRVRSLHLREWLNQPSSWLRWLAHTLIPLRGLRRWMYGSLSHWNVGYVPRPPMPQTLRRLLTAELTPDVERLSVALNRDLGHWLEIEPRRRSAATRSAPPLARSDNLAHAGPEPG